MDDFQDQDMANAQDQDMGEGADNAQAPVQAAAANAQAAAGAAAQDVQYQNVIEEDSDDDLEEQADRVMQLRNEGMNMTKFAEAQANSLQDMMIRRRFKPPELDLFAPRNCDKFLTSFEKYEFSLQRHSSTIQAMPITTCIKQTVVQAIMRNKGIKNQKDLTVEIVREAIEERADTQSKERNSKENVLDSIELAMTKANKIPCHDFDEVCAQYDTCLQEELQDARRKLPKELRLPVIKAIARHAISGPIKTCMTSLSKEDKKDFPTSVNDMIGHIETKLKQLRVFDARALECGRRVRDHSMGVGVKDTVKTPKDQEETQETRRQRKTREYRERNDLHKRERSQRDVQAKRGTQGERTPRGDQGGSGDQTKPPVKQPSANPGGETKKGRHDKKTPCTYCKKPGHLESDCYTKAADEGRTVPVTCFKCKKVGHKIKDCKN
jgi:hypothetical protein